MHSCWKFRADATFIISKSVILSFCIQEQQWHICTYVIKEDFLSQVL